MSYRTIHTRAGLIAMAEAEAAGAAINLTEMAVGDGNGNAVEPDAEQTQLARERYRAAVNRVWQSPSNAQRFTAELVIPAEEGGWTLREVGIFDADGALFAVGNLPEAYKPTGGEGAYSDAVVRLEFMVENADVITLQVDPSIAVASQAWVVNNVTAASIIPGGSVGQLLGKASNADGDVEWQDPDGITVTVDTIAEKQTLASGQTQVDLTATTTYGLAVYIEGLRIDMGSGVEEWQPDASIDTRLHLGQSYTDGSRITLVNNEPAGSAPAPLERNRNLADLESKSNARDNLDVHSKAASNAAGQPGDIKYTARSTAPPGWMKANGAAVSRSAYSELFAVLGTQFGEGDGFSTFNLPDLRGEFIRGWDNNRGVDSGRSLGSNQSDENKRHNHNASSESAGSHSHGASSSNEGGHTHNASSESAGSHSHSGNTDWDGGHSHTGNTDWDGSHSHSGNTSTDGNHWHRSGVTVLRGDSIEDAYGDFGTTSGRGASRASSVTGSDAADSYAITDTSGNHSHSLNINSAGKHQHSLSISSVSNHRHSLNINSAGNHAHTINVDGVGDHTHQININSAGKHTHAISVDGAGDHTHQININSAGNHAHTINVQESGGAETRPRNVALLACIKY